MAKSETVPSIVVHSGSGNANGGGSSNSEMEQRPTNRLSRLAKQEEFDLEENYSPSPITIHIEDGGSGTDENSEANCTWAEGDQQDVEDSDCEFSPTIQNLAPNGTECLSDGNCNGRKGDKCPRSHQRVKLLVRSQAVRDDTSPPPDLETLAANSNMLTVSNVSTFTAQSHTQSKSSNKHQQLGKQGSSQGSVDDSSPTLSRDSSTDTYTDSTGIDLQLFITETLHKSQKDRIMLLKIEQELITLVKDNKCQSYKFPHMSSYNRMLVHRVAAFFGLDHNVDKNGTSVIVNKTKNTRLPDIRFKEQIRDELVPTEPKKLILKRDSASFEDGKEKSPERQSSTDSRRSKSFEEREEEYEKARKRIFNKDEGYVESSFSRSQDGTLSSSRRSSQEDLRWVGEPRPWSSTDSDSSGWKGGGSFESEGATQNGVKTFSVLSKSDSEAKDTLLPISGARPAVTKASSFGGISVLSRENGKSIQKLTKAESFNATTSCVSKEEASPSALSEAPVVGATSPTETNAHCPVPDPPPSPIPSPSPVRTSEQITPVQSPVQEVSSQQTSWEAAGNDVSKTSPPNGKSPPLWQVPTIESLPPGSVIINPSSVAPYFIPENAFYGNKTVPTRAFVVTPLHSFAPSPMPPDSPISTSSNPSPPLASSTYHAAPTVVYIPCVASQQLPSVFAPPPQALPVQQQHNPTRQQAQGVLELRSVHQNGSGTSELVNRMSSMNLPSQGVANPSIQQLMPSPHPPTVDLSKVPTSQSYAFSTTKMAGYVNQAVSSAVPPPALPPQQVPVYYVQQMGNQTLRYVCPVSNSPVVDLKKQQDMIGEPRLHMAQQQVNSHISGQQMLPQGYSLLTFAQNVDNLNLSAVPYFGYTVPSQQQQQQQAAGPVPAYLSHMPVSSPLHAQPPASSSHPTNFGNQQQNHHHGGYHPTFRPQTPPAPNPFLGYTFYGAPQQQQQQQQSGHFASPFVTGGFQVVRPNVPATKIATPPPPSPGVIPNQFPTPPPPHGKGPFVLQLGKDSDTCFMDSQSLVAGAFSNNHDQKCHRIPSIHLGPSPVRVPAPMPVYRHGLSPLMQDVRLLGHPLQHHQFSPLFLPQQRPPLYRYPHPSAALAHQVNLLQQQQHHHQQQQQQQHRAPKLRRQRSKGSAGGSANKNSSSGNNVLEVEGLPDGMKRSEVERYLELITHHDRGAKIQFHGPDGGGSADFVVNSCRHRVVAVFESETAAQSALLNIKTTKFQLRRSAHREFAKSIS